MYTKKYFSYATASIEDLEKEFNTSINTGLSSQAIFTLKKKYKVFEFDGFASSAFTILTRQLYSPIIYLLLGAAFVSILLQDYVNALVIFVIIAVNVLLAFYQEYRAEKAFRLLNSYLVIKVKVRRNNIEQIIDSRELLPGDLISVQLGDAIPADVRFIKTDGLFVDESALTGESVSIEKTIDTISKLKNNNKVELDLEKSNIGFLGTFVVAGVGKAIVISTGSETVFGDIGKLTLESPEESNFNRDLASISKFLIKLALGMFVFVFIINFIIKGNKIEVTELLMFSVALVIALIPEALPVVTTFALSAGAYKLAQNHVIVRRLSAIQDLGEITTFCTDKTGTLTENILTLSDIFSHNNYDPILYGIMGCSDSDNLYDRTLKKILNAEQLSIISKYSLINMLPFESERGYGAVIVKKDDIYLIILKGTFEKILDHCSDLSAQDRESFINWINNHNKNGHQVFAIASKEISDKNLDFNLINYDMSLVGALAFVDPIKHTVFDSIKKIKNRGIDLKILSGDSAGVVGAVAYAINLVDSPEKVLTGYDFEKLDTQARIKAVKENTAFARVTPKQKYQIIEILKNNLHETVGYLGDGINDAPALKIADVGLVVDSASDLAKSAADIILLEKSLGVIANGIVIGRSTFVNTLKYLKITLSSNISNFYSIGIASIILPFLPMLPIQLLLLNMISDFSMISISTDTVDLEDLSRPSIYNLKNLVWSTIIFGAIGSCCDIVFFLIFYNKLTSIFQTGWFLESVLATVFLILVLRSKLSIFKSSKPSIALIFTALIAAVTAIFLAYSKFGQNIFSFVHLNLQEFMLVFMIALLNMIAIETSKILYYRKYPTA